MHIQRFWTKIMNSDVFAEIFISQKWVFLLSYGAAILAITWSYRRYWHGVSGDIGDCSVGITPQMCNRVTNHGDIGTFFRPMMVDHHSKWLSAVPIKDKKSSTVVGICFRTSSTTFSTKVAKENAYRHQSRICVWILLILKAFTEFVSECLDAFNIKHIYSAPYNPSRVPVMVPLNPFGICLPGTELLQSPFRTEFSMGSLSGWYQQSLWCPESIGDHRKHRKALLNIVKHLETLVKHCDTSWTTLKTLWNIMKHSLAIRWDDIGARCGDIGAQCGDLGARVEFPVISVWSFRWYRRRVSGDIGNCGVGITLQMCNRVTNHGDMGTFSRPAIERLNWTIRFFLSNPRTDT